MSLLWKTATAQADDDDLLWLDHTKHENHRPHPMLAEAGIGESPCAMGRCENYDADHDKALDDAHMSRGKGKFRLIDAAAEKFHGYETRINPDTVAAYRKSVPPKKTMPQTFTHKGVNHILDGHHRIIADALEGRKTPVLHTNLDEE
jgi:hypothetical protein